MGADRRCLGYSSRRRTPKLFPQERSKLFRSIHDVHRDESGGLLAGEAQQRPV